MNLIAVRRVPLISHGPLRPGQEIRYTGADGHRRGAITLGIEDQVTHLAHDFFGPAIPLPEVMTDLVTADLPDEVWQEATMVSPGDIIRKDGMVIQSKVGLVPSGGWQRLLTHNHHSGWTVPLSERESAQIEAAAAVPTAPTLAQRTPATGPKEKYLP